MKLILIYGPPAVGKLTVAKELEKITGYSVFHNHLTFDLAASIFPYGTDEFNFLVEKLRIDLIDAASKSGKEGLIFTVVYGVGTDGTRVDDPFIKRVIEVVKTNKGEVFLVKLTCSEKELFNRVTEPSRKQFRKAQSVEKLQEIKEKYQLNETIPFGETLVIDNTEKPASEVAEMIKEHFKL